ncbi:hypothetical protein L3Y34_016544 [Caenorhabditis briggsae]|uniref:Uncharacterized protein n=1 Tax=Caenorhabditis briggsae TaxID=6238 RepID=A0AAE9DZF4_CAEBR|nr:hypothetical protein L3Y34_016544 [Caenorhabditis briggsae]
MVHPIGFDNIEHIDPAYIPPLRRAQREEAMMENLERVGMGMGYADRREVYIVPAQQHDDVEGILRNIPEVQATTLGEKITNSGITKQLRVS